MALPQSEGTNSQSSGSEKTENSSSKQAPHTEQTNSQKSAKKIIAPNKGGLSQGAKVAIGCGAAAAGAAGACLAAPVLLAAAGFGSVGIVGGSFAAGYMSSVGTVAAGGMFATLQSAGMAGLGALGLGAAGTVGAALGGGVGALTALGVKNKLSEKKLKEAFTRIDSGSTGQIYYHELKNLVQNDLNVDITDEKLFEAYKDATKKEDYGTVTLEEFLLMFGFTSENESESDRQQESENGDSEKSEEPRETNEDTFPSLTELFRIFTIHDDDKDGFISYEQFQESLDDLELDVTVRKMRKVYSSVTGSFEMPYKQVHFQNYVSIINKMK